MVYASETLGAAPVWSAWLIIASGSVLNHSPENTKLMQIPSFRIPKAIKLMLMATLCQFLTKQDRDFLVGFHEWVRFVALWEDDDRSIDRRSQPGDVSMP